MRPKFSVLVFLFFFQDNCWAQDSTSFNKQNIKNNAIGIELGGTGLLYSFNYERNFCVKDNSYQSIKIGVSYPLAGTEYVFLPIDYNLYVGKQRHKLFFGAGIICLIGTNASPAGFGAQQDYRTLYNANSYSAISKYNTAHFNSSLDMAYTGKLGYMYTGKKINWYLYYNCFYIRFTYKYYFQPAWLGAGLSFRLRKN